MVDPGSLDVVHLARIAQGSDIALILLTHGHPDHAEGAPRLAEATGAPVRAADSASCIAADPLLDGEQILAAGVWIEVLATPGHSMDSVCFRADDHVLTGDTILGRGTTLVTDLGAYMTTLDRLLGLEPGLRALPGHGAEMDDLHTIALTYLRHRRQRLAQVRAVVELLGDEATSAQIVSQVYGSTTPGLRAVAEITVEA